MTPLLLCATVHSIVLLCKQTHDAQRVIGLLFADTSFCPADLCQLVSHNAAVLLWLTVSSDYSFHGLYRL